MQQGSGLIKRCPECNMSLSKGSCAEHGRVEGIHDLRIKGVIDDGITSQEVILNRKLTEELTGITLAKAKEIAKGFCRFLLSLQRKFSSEFLK